MNFARGFGWRFFRWARGKQRGLGTRITSHGGSVVATAAGAVALAFGGASYCVAEAATAVTGINGGGVVPTPETREIVNWSMTHSTRGQVFQPSSLAELEALVRYCDNNAIKLRPVGSGISPNGIALAPRDQAMVNLSRMNKVVSVDAKTSRVRIQAGARVSEVVDALRPYGLALPMYASIREQEMGGYTQIGAHGSGAGIPPIDGAVVGLTLVTPGKGTLRLSRETEPALLDTVRVGIGAFGVVADVTVQCVPAHELDEHAFTTTRNEVAKNHERWLQKHRHLRYYWMPYSQTVKVVTNDPVSAFSEAMRRREDLRSDDERDAEEAKRMKPMHGLLRQCLRDVPAQTRDDMGLDDDLVDGLSLAQTRDALVSLKPLDADHIARVNRAEAATHRTGDTWRWGDSSDMLNFDCGGSQHVYEVAFPVGTRTKLDRAPLRPDGGAAKGPTPEISFVNELLDEIETRNIPAPCPLEMRWTRGSSSMLSPAGSQDAENDVFCWLGVIMYMPVDDRAKREKITNYFRGEYIELVKDVARKYTRSGVHPHWAKIEVPGVTHPRLPSQSENDQIRIRDDMRQSLQKRYPVDLVRAVRKQLDPRGICSNPVMDLLLSRS